MNFSLVGDMINAIAKHEMNLPANKVRLELDKAIKSHPNAANGEQKIIILFLPIHPEMSPPTGVKMVSKKKSRDANQDC